MDCLKLKKVLLYVWVPAFFLPIQAWTQSQQKNNFSLHGSIKDGNENPLPEASVHVLRKNMQMNTHADGTFHFELTPGHYTVSIRKIGFIPVEEEIVISDKDLSVDWVLSKASYTQIEGAVVTGKTALQEVRETAYNVTALDARALHNTTLDLAHLLNPNYALEK